MYGKVDVCGQSLFLYALQTKPDFLSLSFITEKMKCAGRDEGGAFAVRGWEA